MKEYHFSKSAVLNLCQFAKQDLVFEKNNIFSNGANLNKIMIPLLEIFIFKEHPGTKPGSKASFALNVEQAGEKIGIGGLSWSNETF